jgi:hypothetical protein
MTRRLLAALLLLGACSQAHHSAPISLSPVQPMPPRSRWDSIVAVVLEYSVSRGLPHSWAERPLIVQVDSAFISSSSLPQSRSVSFVLLDSLGAQRVANQFGDFDALTVARFHMDGDTALASAVSRRVYRRRPERDGVMITSAACEFRLRRLAGAWQVDSVLGCAIT